METQNYYREELAPPLWAEATLLAFTAALSGLLIYQLSTGNMVGQNPAPNTVLAAIDTLLVFIYLTFRRLTVILDQRGVNLRYSWISRNIPYSGITRVSLSRVTPEEYGGLGLRYGSNGAEAYSNRFGKAVRIDVKEGKPVLFTPMNPRRVMKLIEEFSAAL